MSAQIDSHGAHGAHDDHHDDGVGHSTLKGYMMGFFLAVVLTAIPFWLVMEKVIPNTQTLAVVLLTFAAIQIVVHMIYFLHMNPRSEGGWNMLALIFTLVIVVITLAGSIWVMFHLNSNMMPGMSHQMTEQQVKNLP
ncbi:MULTISPECIES: cytochrome o ubiquinol oxidase subunit IV [unclassified Luteibacter]|uniref:cytochrome o ubiquinol oxidase subunit IV n=1 Tax=unclassified Luteibacter TaxID=2620188 RepID=UPI0008C8557A|nr:MULTISPECIES: cytochrome o ubiquinol oxidase subunit IV [unclassified Luteibacter]MDR6937668.1 cytochrome o ubiquinol oxidase operon protein cyoD [Luteibacter sp. 3190]SEO38643.1 cytochrome o ubiquinol oxidase operon protein cyoD [Luteibacter sp. UNC138MFCol5.1]SEW28338.1 cytochrome o ubiquinol oxidase operon protein cyoD [Luteibacter sp. 329MFSha]